jgi:hypothetical protein
MNRDVLTILGFVIAASVTGAGEAEACKRSENPAWDRVCRLLDLFTDELRALESELAAQPTRE